MRLWAVGRLRRRVLRVLRLRPVLWMRRRVLRGRGLLPVLRRAMRRRGCLPVLRRAVRKHLWFSRLQPSVRAVRRLRLELGRLLRALLIHKKEGGSPLFFSCWALC